MGCPITGSWKGIKLKPWPGTGATLMPLWNPHADRAKLDLNWWWILNLSGVVLVIKRLSCDFDLYHPTLSSCPPVVWTALGRG